MSDDTLSAQQARQERQYAFPYHYLDLHVAFHRLLRSTPYRYQLAMMTDLVRSLGGGSVLDAGCGDGRLCRELVSAGVADVTGVDYSEAAIGFARVINPNVRFEVQDLTRLQLDRRFDVVIAMEVIEHLPPDVAEAAIARLRDHVADDGHLVVTVPSTATPVEPKHYRHFNATSLTSTLAPHFDVVSVRGYGRLGRSRMVLRALLGLGFFLYPLRRLGPVRRYFRAVDGFYASRLGTGPVDRSWGLIAVCRPSRVSAQPGAVPDTGEVIDLTEQPERVD